MHDQLSQHHVLTNLFFPQWYIIQVCHLLSVYVCGIYFRVLCYVSLPYLHQYHIDNLAFPCLGDVLVIFWFVLLHTHFIIHCQVYIYIYILIYIGKIVCLMLFEWRELVIYRTLSVDMVGWKGARGYVTQYM